jgi:hypothetical protein
MLSAPPEGTEIHLYHEISGRCDIQHAPAHVCTVETLHLAVRNFAVHLHSLQLVNVFRASGAAKLRHKLDVAESVSRR